MACDKNRPYSARNINITKCVPHALRNCIIFLVQGRWLLPSGQAHGHPLRMRISNIAVLEAGRPNRTNSEYLQRRLLLRYEDHTPEP